LHLGSLATALGSFAHARAQGGRWLIRIEDIDHERCKPEYTPLILDALAAHGLNSDGEIMIQSERSAAYADALSRLPTYRCVCSRKNLTHPHLCRNAQHSQGAWRLRSENEDDDFVLRRADGQWTYQLAVVVDDATQGITHVVRGADLSDQVPRHWLLQKLLNLATPVYLHLPLMLGADGQKLSKHNHAKALDNHHSHENLRMVKHHLAQAGLVPE
jgi:glutamyl-Q tRNA(Asp) synthetase